MRRLRLYYYPKGANKYQRRILRSIQRRQRVARRWEYQNQDRKQEAAQRRLDKMEQYKRDLEFSNQIENFHLHQPDTFDWSPFLSQSTYTPKPEPDFLRPVNRLIRWKNSWIVRVWSVVQPSIYEKLDQRIVHLREAAEQNRHSFRTQEEQAKLAHEAKEQQRIAYYESIIQGANLDNIHAELNKHLGSVNAPIPFRYTIQIPSGNVTLMSIEGVSITDLPEKQVRMTVKGNPSWRKKSPSTLRKQYANYLCAICIRMAREVFAFLPSMDTVKINVFQHTTDTTSNTVGRKCLVAVSFSRKDLESINNMNMSPLTFIQNFNGVIVDRQYNLSEVLPIT
jgi:hypothetical protein